MVSSISYSLGIGSGLDINNLVENLTAADLAPKEAAIKKREDANAAKVSALAEASQGLDAFSSALSTLVSGGSLFSQPTVSDPTIMSATAIAGARLTSLSSQIEVVQLAKAQTLESTRLADANASVGQGDLTLTTAAGSVTVTIDATNDSLSGLAKAINDKNAGLTASIVTDSLGARLVLKGATGEDAAFTLSVPNGTATGLERFAYPQTNGVGMTEAQAAQNALVILDGVQIARSTNSFSDLLPGVQIDLKKADPGTVLSIGLTRPKAAIQQAVKDFVAAFNELSSALAKSASPGVSGSASGPLRGDLAVGEIRRKLASLPTTILNSTGTIKTLSEIGVATNRDGSIRLDETRLVSALESDPAAVEALFNPAQTTSSPLIEVTSAVGKTAPGTYQLTDIVAAANGGNASGKIDGIAANGLGDFLIAPSSSKAVGMVVKIKGAVTSATITIDPGLAGALKAIRDEVLGRSGVLSKSQERYSSEAKRIATDRTTMESRSKSYHDKLLSNFTAMERRVSAFKATQSYLEQQVKAWNGDS